MAEFIARWFTPSNSDRGAKAPVRKQPQPAVAEKSGVARAKTPTKFGGKRKIKEEAEIAKKVLLGA